MKERLDVLVVSRGLAPSREKAKAIIMAGNVLVDGQREDKAGSMFKDTVEITVKGHTLPYVSRGGLKLEKAMTHVVCMERTNIRYVVPEDIQELSQFTSIDVSFISLTKVLLPVRNLLTEDGEVVCLIKPQFEAGREKVGKKGVVRDPAVHREVIEMVTAYAQSISFAPCHLEFSPIKGPEGNIEYLLHLKKLPEGEHCEEVPFKIDEVVEAAHKELSSTTPHPAQKR